MDALNVRRSNDEQGEPQICIVVLCCRWAGELPQSNGAMLIHNSAPDWVASTATLESISEYADYWCAVVADCRAGNN